MKKRILSMLLCFCMVLGLLPMTALAADPTPVTELWVGSTQVVQSGGTVTADTSGPGWNYDSTTATLTLNGANITTTTPKNGVTGPSGSMDYYYYYGVYCYGDLNIVVTGDSSIDARAAADRSCGLWVSGNLSVSGSAELTTKGNWRGLCVNESLSLSGAVTLSGIAGGGTYDTLIGVYVVNSITVSDTASLLGHALSSLYNYGVRSLSGNITIGSEATLTGIADSYTGEGDGKNYGVTAGNFDSTSVLSGQVNVEGTMVARAGNGVNRGNTSGLFLYETNLVVSNNGSVRAECGDTGFGGATAYGVNGSGNATITVNAGGFRASGGTCAIYPATTNVTIDGTPVFYEVSTNRDGSSPTVITDTATWNSTYNEQFGAYKYINATTRYEVYINGTQVTRTNRHNVLDDGTVSYLPSVDGSPARLTLNGASLTTVQLDGDTEFALTGASSVGTVTDVGAVTVSGSGGLTLTGSLDCGSKSLTVGNGAALTVQGTVTAGAVVNGGMLINEGALILPEGTTVEQIQAMNLTGDGIVKAGSKFYLGGILYADGGDKSSAGIDLSTLPSEGTYYTAGDGYALFTPATADPAANAKLELRGTVVSTTDATTLTLPTDAPVDIIVASDSSLTAGGSGNVIYTNGQALSVTGSGDLTLAGPYYGISVNGSGAVSINITGNLTFDTGSQPISTSGDITVSAKSITSKSGYYFNTGSGSVSLTATDGDIALDDTGKTNKQEKIKAYGDITLNAPKGKIDITDGGSGSYALNSSLGIITVTALNDVIINASSGGDIYSGKTDTFDVVSVNSTNGSIQMSCGDSYECVQASGGVALTAAKDITLNGTENSTAAIQATGKDVSITAGGKLSSATAYGFQVGTLTIKADEVSVAGTSQDGVQANSVSITKDGTNNCKSVSITATSSSDSRAAINSSNVTIKADDVLICGNSSAKAINAANPAGTVTIGDAGMIIGAVSISGTSAINPNILKIESNGGDASAGLDLSTPPSVITYYTAGNGYALFTPANGEAKATLTLHNASIISVSATPLDLGAETVIKLEGANSLTNSKTDSGVGIQAYNSGVLPLTIQSGSDDSLTVSAWQCTRMGALTIDGGRVTMDGTVYGILTEGNVVLKNGARVSASGGDFGDAVQLEDPLEIEQYSLTVSNGSTLTINESSAYISGNLTISGSGSKVTVNSGATASVVGAVKVENSGVLENNGIWQMELGTTVNEIKALKLSGSGVVRVWTNEDVPPTWDTYTNDGVALKDVGDALDLSTGDHSGKTVEGDGYAWNADNNTLTLGNAYIAGNLTLPAGAIVNTTAPTLIQGNIEGKSGTPMNITLGGTASLSIGGGISGAANGDTVTVRGGAQVTTGRISIGASGGAGGTLNVTGTGTSLTVSEQHSSAVYCEAVNVTNGATLTASSETVGIAAMGGDVTVTGGSTLTTNCKYGVYISNGKLTVDASSKLITNGTVAPFCIVDSTSGKSQSDVLALPGVPAGTQIASVTGTSTGSARSYWSIIPANGSLSVSNENNDVVDLFGAKTGTLTFIKASSGGNDNNGGGSGGGASGSSTSYTLTFVTNGGTAISSISKASGTVIDLSGYKPTRDGYNFDGWYADTALTTKVTSVTLTKGTTVYAKWTEKTVQSANPFVDVADSAYYHDAVLWAVEKGITSGTTGTTFSPDMICTRAQAVTFLWRAMGSPEPTSANCPFTDVSADAYYHKAVLWAVEKGIVKGTSPTTFSPSDTVTRSQSMTFLWRAAGETTSTSANPFADVPKDAYYYNAVLWAVEKDITKGTSDTAFSPDGGCTRAQIVTFLYRYMGE